MYSSREGCEITPLYLTPWEDFSCVVGRIAGAGDQPCCADVPLHLGSCFAAPHSELVPPDAPEIPPQPRFVSPFLWFYFPRPDPSMSSFTKQLCSFVRGRKSPN